MNAGNPFDADKWEPVDASRDLWQEKGRNRVMEGRALEDGRLTWQQGFDAGVLFRGMSNSDARKRLEEEDADIHDK